MGGEMLSKGVLNRTKEALSMIDSNSIYFAHPVNYYMGSEFNVHGDKEEELMRIIAEEFPGYNVFNPNQKLNQDNYVLWKKETGSGMNYYFDVILPEMVAGVGLPFEDGMFGAGVYGEMEKFVLDSKPVFEIRESGAIVSINSLNKSRKLSVEETQDRVYGKN